MTYTILLNSAGLLILAGFSSVVFSLVTHQVTTLRKPIYYVAALLAGILVAIYFDFASGELFGLRFIPPGHLRWAFITVYVMVGCLLVLVPWTDRREFRETYEPTARLSSKIEGVIDSLEDSDGGG